MSVNFLVNFNFRNAIGNNNANPNPCPDQIVGSFLCTTFTPNNTRQSIDYMISLQLDDPIVLILESPHINEYDSITSMALGPAMGNTGKNLKNYFASIIQNSKIYPRINSSPHHVVLVNSIQYQCSLGNKLSGKGSYKNKKQRDLNWLTCFNNGNSNDLMRRISAINPCAIINLCTIGLYNLQQRVDNHVKSNLNQIPNQSVSYTIGSHPSTWICGKGIIQ